MRPLEYEKIISFVINLCQ